MVRETLVDFFEDLGRQRGAFLVHDNGYRTWTYSYAEVAGAARVAAAALRAAGLTGGDKVVVWSENRPEWIVALWAALLEGVVVVPADFRASAQFVRRIAATVGARLVLVGDEVEDVGPTDAAVWRLAEIGAPRPADPPARAGAFVPTRDTIAEIIFTSGATADPKGVVIRHRNVLANIVPVEREIARYRGWGRPFFPLRFLNLLPLSHLFGQAMATFIPPMLPGTVVFMHGFSPAEIVRQVRSRRVSVLVCVPKILEILKEHVLRVAPEAGGEPGPAPHWVVRWWRYRRVHRLFGWKFWSFVVGAAPLDPALEEFWSRLGFLVIQGYGLTETAPIVTLNHPFRSRRGSVGTPLAGVEVRIAEDGEILVRGENVTTGYFGQAPDPATFADGWFHTGDIGELDESGRLLVKGRKKEMIVRPDGLNVFPDDVERVLIADPAVRDAAVVGAAAGAGGGEQVHAVIVLAPGGDADAVVRRANQRLEDHQRIRAVSRWPAADLPRTEGTRKLKRAVVRRWVEQGGAEPAAGGNDRSVASVLARFAGDRAVDAETTLDDLGLSSLERLEVLMALEDRYQTSLDEAAFGAATRVGDLQALVDRPAAAASVEDAPLVFPRWTRRWLGHAIRRFSLPLWILPLARLFAWIRVEGLEHLRDLKGPVVFAANHQSHMDTPVILAALPPRWRYRVAVAMAKEFFKAHFFPDRYPRRARLTNTLNYLLASLFFNAFPLPQREAGTRQTLRYIGELAGDGWSILIFPEGRRTDAGEIGTFQAGVGMIGARLGLPVVPVRLEGLDRVLHHSWHMARPGRARVRFGTPMLLTGDDFADQARRVEAAVAAL